MLRKADEPKLADAIVKLVNNEGIDRSIDRNEDELTHQFVLDGVSLLHRLGWKKNITYGEIADSYSTFVVSKYGKAIVFDGYNDGPSTKDKTHLRRNQKHLETLNALSARMNSFRTTKIKTNSYV